MIFKSNFRPKAIHFFSFFTILFFLGTAALSAQSPGGVNSSFQLWLKADTGVTNSTGVSNWIDQSPNSLTGVQSNANNRPTFIPNTINFHPSIDFQGTPTGSTDSDFDFINFGSVSLGLTNKVSVFYVGNIDQAGVDHYVIGQKNGFDKWRYANGYMQVIKGGTFKGDILDNFTQEVNRNYIHGYVLDDTSGYHTKNGTALPSESFPAGNWLTDEETWVGGTEIGGQYSYDGQISEIIVYNETLNSTEQNRIESYLALKYGISLDQTTATDYLASDGGILWDASVNVGYTTDIFGIGRDDASGLDQRVSKSINNGSIITIALDTDLISANNNISRTTTHSNDKQFLVVANNGAATTTQTTEIDTDEFETRISREWKVDKTVNFAQNVNLKFNGFDRSWQLIKDNDGDFTTGATILGRLDNNGEILNVPLNDGEYLTLAKSEEAPGGELTDLTIWLKADAGTQQSGSNVTANGATIDRWNNQVINGATHFTESEAPDDATLLTNALNFNSVIDIDDNDRMHLAGTSIAGDYLDTDSNTAYIIYTQNNDVTSSADVIFQFENGGDGARFNLENNPVRFAAPVNSNYAVANTTFTNGKYNMLSLVDTKTASGDTNTIFINGKQNAQSTNSGDIDLSNGRISIGARDVNDNHSDINIAEFIIFKNEHDAPTRNRIESYLAIKYGFTLDQTTPTDYVSSEGSVVWDGTINAGYKTDIFGIGRDDASSLDQKVSKSANSDAVLTIALDNDFSAANNDNGRTTSHNDDLQFLVVSNNGASLNTQATELDANTGFNIRLAREWKISAANFNQNVSVKFEGYDDSWTIIASTDGDFSSDVEIMGNLNVDGEFTTVNPPQSGSIFTIAKFQESPGGVISDLQLWLKADSGVTPAQWKDQSGVGNNALQPVAANQPNIAENGINFNPKVEFSGLEYLDFSSDLGLVDDKDFEIVTVFNNYSTATGFNAIIATATPYTSQSIQFATNGSFPRQTFVDSNGGLNVPGQSLSANILANTPTIINQTRTGTSTLNVFNNGSLVDSKNMGTGSFVSGNLRLAGSSMPNGSFVYGFKGEINEVIVFAKSLSSTERLQIQSYLAVKYGVTIDQSTATNYLSSDGSVIWDGTVDLNYKTDIFGIGRDDASGLNQKISKSINSDAVLTIALDNDFNTANNDSGRTTSHSNDLQFIVVANNDGALTNYTTEIDVNAYAARIEREWKVDKTTSFTQDINLKFSGFDETWELIKDSDGDFSSGATSLGTLDSNGEITGISLENGEYFTLHTNTYSPTILSFSPVLAGNGDTVTIIGNGFTGTTSVTFGGVEATSFTVVSATEITAVVGTGSSGEIKVTNPQGNDTETDLIYKVAQYDFENNVLDETDNDYDGTEINTVTYETGAQGQAICFEDGPGYVKLPDNLIRNLPQFTISLRFKTTGNGAILGYQNAEALNNSLTNYIPIIMIDNDGKLKGTLWTGTGNGSIQAISANTVNDGNWHQVDLVGASNSVSIYLDGNLEANQSGAPVDHIDMSYNQLGLSYTNGYNTTTPTAWEYFDGCIDDMVIIDKALTAQELDDITALPEPTISSFTPTSAGEDYTIVITGTNFNGATQVTFGGSDATSYTVDSATQISAVVSTGATGDVSVTTAGGTATATGFTYVDYTVSQTTLTIDEDGGAGTFTVLLGAEPTSNVVFDISSDDTDQATVSDAQLTFTTTNWDTPQTITVTGVNDNIDRDDFATITVAVNDVGSDNAFDALADQTVAITLTDDDSAAYTVSETSLTIDENGGTGTFTVVLDTEPTSNVVFDISSDDNDEATVSIAQLTFTTANWDTPQSITVTGVDDNTNGNDSATIIVAVNDLSSDDGFDALSNQTVSVTLIDVDEVPPTLVLGANQQISTDTDNCSYTVQGTELDPTTATDDSGSLASLNYSIQAMTANPNLIEENFDSGSWDSNNFELGTNTGSVVNGAYKSDTSSRGTLRSVAEFIPTLGNPLYLSATLSYANSEGLAFFGTRSTGEQPSGIFNSEPVGLIFRLHNFNEGQTSISTGYDYQPRPGSAFYNNPVRFEIIDDGASVNVTMTNLVTNVVHTYSFNSNYTSGTNRVVFSGDNSVSWDDIKISVGPHETLQEYDNGSDTMSGKSLNIGENTVTWTATDAGGNQTVASQVITIEDTTNPVVVTQNITITLDINGEASIMPAQINNNSTDNCGIATLVLDKEDFTAADTGDNTVTLTVTDIHGNVNTDTALITVINPDIDGDGVNNDIDNCPSIANTDQLDTDNDGNGNVCDDDDDNDGTTDTGDAFPLDPTEDTDTDGDGTGDNEDTDDDGDGVPDTEDTFPLDENESTDTDGDGTGDNADTDDDKTVYRIPKIRSHWMKTKVLILMVTEQATMPIPMMTVTEHPIAKMSFHLNENEEYRYRR